MGTTLLTIVIIIACGWLALSAYLAAAETEAALLHADYKRCPKCHHHYFAPKTGPNAHDCASIGFAARTWDALMRPIRHARRITPTPR